jgi:NADH dehydrogenase FAD-containing subunit
MHEPDLAPPESLTFAIVGGTHGVEFARALAEFFAPARKDYPDRFVKSGRALEARESLLSGLPERLAYAQNRLQHMGVGFCGQRE